MIANKDYLLIKAIKKAKCCCNGKDEGDDQSQTTLKKFAELTLDDINYMMDYSEDLPVCDVMVGYDETTDENTIIDTVGSYPPSDVYFYFSTEEKAQEAIQHGFYGDGLRGIKNTVDTGTIGTYEVNGTIVYYTPTVLPS